MVIIWMIFFTIALVLLTFVVPFWVRVILLGLNLLMPDLIPFVDEILQAYAVFIKNPWIKTARHLKTASKVVKTLSDEEK